MLEDMYLRSNLSRQRHALLTLTCYALQQRYGICPKNPSLAFKMDLRVTPHNLNGTHSAQQQTVMHRANIADI